MKFASNPCANTLRCSYLSFTPTEVNWFFNSVTSSLCKRLDTVAPVKKKGTNQMFDSLKQITDELERKWHCTNLEVPPLPCEKLFVTL